MESHLASLILHRGGPLTVAEFMHHVLTHPLEGYYTTKEHVFGSRGDFVTSPDISQMFGECVGIWAVAMWQQMGSPSAFKIVELGPGRGTLISDLMRGTKCFRGFHEALVEVGLVEVSDALREQQLAALAEVDSEILTKVKHYSDLEDIPEVSEESTLYIGHEFLDALPVHQFVKRDGAWREVLVDVNDDGRGESTEIRGNQSSRDNAFRLVLAPYETFASKTILPARLRDLDESTGNSLGGIEVSPACIGLASTLSRRIKSSGGAALLIDYGKDGPYENSLVAIQDHAFVEMLTEPGKVDLSAYVDFDALRSSCSKEGIEMHGPVDQGVLLKALGIDERLRMLMEATEIAAEEAPEDSVDQKTQDQRTQDQRTQDQRTQEQRKRLLEGYRRLVGSDEGEMGERYKAVCLSQPGTRPVAF
jgi:NADH dehydrogenase [ubiquinone] 1 alpha subcomplex assembly factor 7